LQGEDSGSDLADGFGQVGYRGLDPLPVLDQREVPHSSVQPSVFDGDTCSAGQGHRQALVFLGELGAGLLFGQVEIAEDR
jgi:hypothetical protein